MNQEQLPLHIHEEIFSALLLNVDIPKNIKAIKNGKTSFKKHLFSCYEITEKEFQTEFCYYQHKKPVYFNNKKFSYNG